MALSEEDLLASLLQYEPHFPFDERMLNTREAIYNKFEHPLYSKSQARARAIL